MIKKIDHVGIAVQSHATAKDVYEGLLGFHLRHAQEVPSQKVRTAFYPCGDVNLELLESTDAEGPIGKFLANRGEGIHHVAFEVDDIRAELARLASRGVRLIDPEPRKGAHDAWVAFVHPKSTRGVLVELVQHTRPH